MPQPDPTLAEIIAQLEAQLAAKDQQLARKDQALALAEVKIKLLEERLRLDRIARYGKRSETLNDLQLQLLDLEPGVSSEEVDSECFPRFCFPQHPQNLLFTVALPAHIPALLSLSREPRRPETLNFKTA